jgi:hypothetical protein
MKKPRRNREFRPGSYKKYLKCMIAQKVEDYKMSGAIKHMERSHRSYGKNYSEFNRFAIRASHSKYSKTKRTTMAEKIISGIRNMFKRQAKGDK